MKNPAILIVEGDEILHQDLKSRLFHHGFEVIEAFDKTSALQFFQARKPNLVIICSSGDNRRASRKRAGQGPFRPLCHQVEQEQGRPETPVVQDDPLPQDGKIPYKYFTINGLATDPHGPTQTFCFSVGICKDRRGPKVVTEEHSLSNPGFPRGGNLLGQMIF